MKTSLYNKSDLLKPLSTQYNTLVISSRVDQEEKQQKLLATIMGAVKKNVGEDVKQLVYTSDNNMQLGDLLQSSQLSTLIIFGVDPSLLGLQGRFQVNRISKYGSLKIITAPSLTQIEQDVAAKKLLWSQLQLCFPR